MFHAAFNQDPMSHTQGNRYRRMILEKGSREDEMDFLNAFLGRPPSTDALRTELERGSDFFRCVKSRQPV